MSIRVTARERNERVRNTLNYQPITTTTNEEGGGTSHQPVVVVHEVVVCGVLCGVLGLRPQDLFHVGRVTPTASRSIHRRDVVEDERLRNQRNGRMWGSEGQPTDLFESRNLVKG